VVLVLVLPLRVLLALGQVQLREVPMQGQGTARCSSYLLLRIARTH
jgi:hypothetical protein